MAEDDPYVSPYAALSPLTVGNRQAADAYAARHRADIARRDEEMQGIQGQQQMTVDQMSKLLDDTATRIRDARANRGVNLPLLALGANMMGNGDFGTQVGRGLRAMGPAIEQGREQDEGAELKLAGLGLQKAQLQNLPLSERLKYIQALQVGDTNALRAIEQADIRTSGTGQDPAMAKEWRIWQQEPGNENKPLSEYMKFKQGVQARTPAELQIWEKWHAENPGRTFSEFVTELPKLKAAGTEQGKEQGQNLLKLPSAVNAINQLDIIIDKIRNHPGLKDAVGNLGTILPALPGSKRADFEALLKQLSGQQFLAAFDTLRGAGAITEIEGSKATEALGNLNPHQSVPQFLQQLEEAQRMSRAALGAGRQKAGLDPMQTSVPPGKTSAGTPPPQTGQTPSGEIKKGAPAMDPGSGSPLKNGRTATDPSTNHKLVVRDGVWVEM